MGEKFTSAFLCLKSSSNSRKSTYYFILKNISKERIVYIIMPPYILRAIRIDVVEEQIE